MREIQQNVSLKQSLIHDCEYFEDIDWSTRFGMIDWAHAECIILLEHHFQYICLQTILNIFIFPFLFAKVN